MRRDVVTFFLICILAGAGLYIFSSTSVVLSSSAHDDATVVFRVS